MTHRERRRTRRAVAATRSIFIAVAGVFTLLPILWTISTSLKADADIVRDPPMIVPNPIEPSHFADVALRSALPAAMVNSLILEALTIGLVLLVGVPAGYGAARFSFRGKGAILTFLLATIMIPGIVILIPQYLIGVQLGLQGTFLGLTLIFAAWQTPMVIWIMKAYFEQVPVSLDEAAMVDGASRPRTFLTIVLPLAWPGIAASAIVVFLWVWNEFIISLVMASNATRPLTVALYYFVGETGIDWGRLSAGAVIVLFPAVAFYLIFQKRLIAGLMSGAVK